ncbi:response regulator [Candidatus Manganitrophus noduliformans]|uniref:Response regulator n=1 Tax=Candidatus Manganitrophus noduliformans TaxID=2606439 RepID=A0A7X6IAU1_9BACT|nr:response regulator [Candidatus Manganitrophus noduliformans]NKE70836.1 response regulator [Candidatus Manganitrophus noduliformans]
MSSQTLQPVKILLVEDNLQDIEITRRAFARGKVKNELIVVRDGQEALDYLYHQGKYSDLIAFPRPGMILLDLNLPKVGGMEVLQQIKKDEGLKSIPVIVLTASPREEDVVRTYNLGVNTYIQKPVEFDNFMRVVHAVQEYWIVIASLPPSG